MTKNTGNSLDVSWLLCNNHLDMRDHPNMSAQGDDLDNYSFPCSIQNNDTCKAVMMSHLLVSLFSAYFRYLSFFWQRSDTLSKLTADWWNADLDVIDHLWELCFAHSFYALGIRTFCPSQYIMLYYVQNDFVDVGTLTPVVRLEDIHTLVCDGYNDGQEGHWGYEWMCGIGMRHLVSLYYNNLYFSLLQYDVIYWEVSPPHIICPLLLTKGGQSYLCILGRAGQ